MEQRLEIIKFEEFNRWANRWYPLRLPLEEIKEEQEGPEIDKLLSIRIGRQSVICFNIYFVN